MKVKVFDVVKLNNGNKATILEKNDNNYKIEMVNDNGITIGFININDNDIKEILFSK